MNIYRQDIDGLRAFAVLAVIVNHADPTALSSGFLGVDVFFVISGYVIALSLMSNASQPFGGFLRGFYTRRIKRLMPGLSLCVALSSVVLLVIDPDPATSLWTGLAGLIGVANIHLYFQQLDYFATDTGFNAFTHMWSLGIEEQFYLLLPALAWILLRAPSGRLLWAIGVLSVLSFAAFLALRATQPVASFYLLHTRFWELGAGVMLALVLTSRGTAAPLARRWIGWQGLILLGLLAAMALAFPDPRVLTTLVVGLAVLLIAAPDRSRLLDNALVTYLGRLSYTLYLWHWPLLVFERLSPDAVWTQPAVLIALLFGLSMLSYHLVEQPLRHSTWSSGRGRVAISGMLASGLAIGAAVTLSLARPFAPSDAPPALALEINTLPLPSGAPFDPTCVVDDERRRLEADTFDTCTFPPEPGSDAPTIWALGDSHAGHFQGLLVQLHQERGIGFHLVETVGQVFPPPKTDTPSSRQALVERMLPELSPGDIVLISRLYLTRSEPASVLPGVLNTWIPSLKPFIDQMAERSVKVVVSGPLPAYGFPDIRACNREDAQSCAVPRARILQPVSEVETALDSLVDAHDNLRILHIFDTLCPEAQETCHPSVDGVFTMRDRDHLNVYGASLLKDRFLEVIDHRRVWW